MITYKPLLITAFSRPDYMKVLLDKLANKSFSKFYFAIDTPRNGFVEQEKLQKEVLVLIEDFCRHHKNSLILKHSENQGCKIAMQKAITWFFEQEEMGMILEDDCIPGESFFDFASEMLDRYQDDDKAMHVSGSNFQLGRKRGKHSYYASKVPHIWGWATWRRAWQKYESYIDPTNLPEIKQHLNNDLMFEYHEKVFKKTNDGEINTWDYQWFYTIWKYRGTCITPNKNLITNIGFGIDATHTTDPNNSLAALQIEALKKPINHPTKLVFNETADHFYLRNHLVRKDTLLKKVVRKTRSILKP